MICSQSDLCFVGSTFIDVLEWVLCQMSLWGVALLMFSSGFSVRCLCGGVALLMYQSGYSALHGVALQIYQRAGRLGRIAAWLAGGASEPGRCATWQNLPWWPIQDADSTSAFGQPILHPNQSRNLQNLLSPCFKALEKVPFLLSHQGKAGRLSELMGAQFSSI